MPGRAGRGGGLYVGSCGGRGEDTHVIGGVGAAGTGAALPEAGRWGG